MSRICTRCRISSRTARSELKSVYTSLDSLPSSSRSLSRNSAIAKGLRDSRGEKSERRESPSYGSLAPPSSVRERYQQPTRLLRRYEQITNSAEKQPEQAHPARGRNTWASSHSVPSRASTDTRGRIQKDESAQAERPSTEHLGAAPRSRDWKPTKLPEPIPYTTASSVFIVGARGVIAALRSRRRKCYKLYILSDPDTSQELKHNHALYDRKLEIEELAWNADVRVERVDSNFFSRILNEANRGHKSQDSPHNGVILEASTIPLPAIKSLSSIRSNEQFTVDRAYQSAEDASIHGVETTFPFSSNGWRQPFLLWLHGVLDSNNAGAMIRTATYFGADGVLLSGRETARLTLGTLRSSVGAADYMRLFVITEKATQFIRSSQTMGWKFVATVAPNEGDYFETVAEMKRSPLMNDPTVLIMGSEFTGLDKSLVSLADQRLSISGRSELADIAGVDSLNVSVAAALLMERLLRRPAIGDEEELAKVRSERLF